MKTITRFIAKNWWKILGFIALIIFTRTYWKQIFTVLELTLLGCLIATCLHFLLKIPAVTTARRKFKTAMSSSFRDNPKSWFIVFLVLTLIVAGFIFIPKLVSNSNNTVNPNTSTTQTPSSAPQPTDTSTQSSSPPAVVSLTPETFEGYSITFVPENGSTVIPMTAYADSRNADENVASVTGYEGDEYFGNFEFDFNESGKSIASVNLIRFDIDTNFTKEFNHVYDSSNLSTFPYPDKYVMTSYSAIYSFSSSRISLEVTFTDGTIFKCFFSFSG